MKDKKRVRMTTLAGVEATLRKGRESDEEHNRRPVPARVVIREPEKATVPAEVKRIEPMPRQEEGKEPKEKAKALSEIEEMKARILELERLEKDGK